jgi:predicted transcriptional regulator
MSDIQDAILKALRLVHGEPLWVTEIAKAVGRDTPTVVRELGRLELASLVVSEWEADPPASRWRRRLYRLVDPPPTGDA